MSWRRQVQRMGPGLLHGSVQAGESQAALAVILFVILVRTVTGPSSPRPNADYAQQQKKDILIY